MPWKCCGTSVGVLITDETDRILMIERATHPAGIAPVAGHAADEGQPSFQAAAVAEAREEVGLALGELAMRRVYHRRLPNLCGAEVPADPPGHEWVVYRAPRWTGRVDIAPDEARGYGWYSRAEVQALADRTAEHAARRHAADIGLEPVWVAILAEIGFITTRAGDRERIMAIATEPPNTRRSRR